MSNIERALRRAAEGGTGPTTVPAAPAPPEPQVPDTEAKVAGVWKLDERIVAYHERYTAPAEAFRKLGAKLLTYQHQRELPCLLVGVTSPSHAEGKSITAANLAVVLAQDFRVRTLLVDADIRRPTFARYLDLDLDTGLADLVDGASVEETVIGTPLPHLQILGSGRRESPTGVFEAGRLNSALERLRRAASIVVFDCPPVLPVADTDLLATALDGMLLLVRAGYTQGRDIRRMIATLEGANLLGFVLNYADRASPLYYHAEAYYGELPPSAEASP